MRQGQGSVELDRSAAISIGKEAVLSAFGHVRISSESPIAHFMGQPRPKEKRKGSAAARHQVKAVETRPPGFSKPALLGRQELTGYVHRLIADLDPISQSWIQHRYRRGAAKVSRATQFRNSYFNRYQAEHLKNCKSGTRWLVRHLIAAAMESRRLYEPKGSRLPDPPEALAIDRRQWTRTFKPHWQRIRLELDQIDSSALSQIGLKIME